MLLYVNPTKEIPQNVQLERNTLLRYYIETYNLNSEHFMFERFRMYLLGEYSNKEDFEKLKSRLVNHSVKAQDMKILFFKSLAIQCKSTLTFNEVEEIVLEVLDTKTYSQLLHDMFKVAREAISQLRDM